MHIYARKVGPRCQVNMVFLSGHGRGKGSAASDPLQDALRSALGTTTEFGKAIVLIYVTPKAHSAAPGLGMPGFPEPRAPSPAAAAGAHCLHSPEREATQHHVV